MTDLTPVGRLLEAAREKMTPKPSQNEVARRAGTSGTTYRNTINGFARHGGIEVPYAGAPETIARFSRVVGVDSAQLREAGRDDAADILLDSEVEEEHGHKSDDQLDAETKALLGQVEDELRRQGRDLDSRQRRVLKRWSRNLIETLDEFDVNNNAS